MIESLQNFFDGKVWASIDAIYTILTLFVIVWGWIKLFDTWNTIRKFWYIFSGNHIIVIGLEEKNRIYLDSEIESGNKRILVIEINKNNLFIEEYKKKGICVISSDALDNKVLNKLNIYKSKHILVSTSKDMDNLEISTQILNIEKNANLYVHLQDRNLRHFHKENGIFKNSNVKIYSYYSDTARELFERFDIDGKDFDIIGSKKSFSLAIVGDTNLAYEIIYQASLLGQLPNENKLTIYCIDKDIIEFQQNVEIHFTEIKNVPNVELKYISLDINSKDFYEHDLWSDNLKNIVLCFENDQKNLDIAANLANITYLDKLADNQMNTNILISMFHEIILGNTINKNENLFKSFYTFGNKINICHKRYIIDEQRDKKAIATNEIYRLNSNNGKEWSQLSYFEQESNRASADHIKIKQKYIDSKSNCNYLEILSKCEHNRWNAFHFLHGYSYGEKNHLKKKHNCLINYEELSEEYKDYDRDMVKNINKIYRFEKNKDIV